MTSAWRRSLERALDSSAPVPPPRADHVPVVVCVWQRVRGLDALVDDLLAQQTGPRPEVVLWCNHPGRLIDVHAAARRLRSAGIDALVIASRTNLGGLARYVVAHRLHAAGWRGPVVTIDDDMRIGPDFLARLLSWWEPRSLVGVWAWRVRHGYWDREMVASGTPADYVGAGGAAVDLDAFGDRALFDRLPDAYAMIEDLWLTRWLRARGWRIVGADAPFLLDDDDHGLGHAIRDRKGELWDVVDELVVGAGDPDARLVQLRQPSRVEVAGGLARGLARRAGVGRALLRARHLVNRVRGA